MRFGSWGQFCAFLAPSRKKAKHFELTSTGVSSRWGNPVQDHISSMFAVPSSSVRCLKPVFPQCLKRS